jgi:hypothetical protein
MSRRIARAVRLARLRTAKIELPTSRGELIVPPKPALPATTPKPAVGRLTGDEAPRAVLDGRCAQTGRPFELTLRFNRIANRYFCESVQVTAPDTGTTPTQYSNPDDIAQTISGVSCPHCRSPLAEGACQHGPRLVCRPQDRFSILDAFICPGHCHGDT